MAIEKMSLVNLVGNMVDLDETLINCLKCGYFHQEMAINSSEVAHGFTLLEGDNPYYPMLNDIIKLSDDLKIQYKKIKFDFNSFDIDDTKEYIKEVNQSVFELVQKQKSLKESIYQHEQAVIQIEHLAGLNISFDEIFACKYVKVRFGRLPYDSFEKLNYYDDKTFFFFPFDHNDEYYWGIYFAPATKITVIDDIFSSLYFERLRVPDYAHGTPEIAKNNIDIILKKEKEELEQINKEINLIKEKNEKELNRLFCLLKFAHKTYDLRKYVATVNNRFYILGFIPKAYEETFNELFNDLKSVSCTFRPYDADPTLTPPVKLKNSKFSAPFESFVKMYSLPSHNDIDPTSLVAITYTLLFGIMFGDLGQGLVFALLGFFLSKVKKVNLGKIMSRIGFSSAFFGFLYGSVFGYEELLDPFYHSVFGLVSKPIHVFETNTTNALLGGAIGIGAVLIVISISINIYLGFKTKNYERAIFGHNGIAGLTLYASVGVAAVSSIMFDKKIINTPYVLIFIVLPILMIFFREPLSRIMKKQKDIMPKGIGEFIIENFFELFEYLLSYLSNSMSFLRVGGFILSHAGMMAVVMSLSEMAGSTASPIVVVIGNIFVMCLEGLIVGIQVLRLEFYEIFSRNFEGNGKAFEPVSVTYEIEN